MSPVKKSLLISSVRNSLLDLEKAILSDSPDGYYMPSYVHTYNLYREILEELGSKWIIRNIAVAGQITEHLLHQRNTYA